LAFANEKHFFSFFFFLFFPQEMASSFSRNNDGIPLATLLEWYKIRDTFFGHNDSPQNIPLALELAGRCQHPDALWLTEACAGKDVTTKEDANRIFSALGQNDARALCFSWVRCEEDGSDEFASLRRSAELGYAFAQATLAGWMKRDEKFRFAQRAAAQGERDGFAILGYCYRVGEGCEEDLNKQRENFLRASELGEFSAMIQLGWLLDESDPRRWYWWGRAATGRFWSNFYRRFANQVKLFNSGSGNAAVMFAIGRALQGHVNEEREKRFSDKLAISILSSNLQDKQSRSMRRKSMQQRMPSTLGPSSAFVVML
jgi:TPR repeat protein